LTSRWIPVGGQAETSSKSGSAWGPAIESAGIATPRPESTTYRSTFISNALANDLTVFETARVAGTPVKMIERHYGALLDSAHESLLERLERVG
jgi:hypothetical protein